LTHSGDKPYSCNECDFKCAQSGGLKHHMTMNHSVEKRFSCDECDYKSNHKREFRKHELEHVNGKGHECSICNYRCKLLGDLKVHLRVHTNERPFDCKVCGKVKYKQAHSLKNIWECIMLKKITTIYKKVWFDEIKNKVL